MDITIVIVSYNCKNLLEECLASVYENVGVIDFEVFVVDNNSTDGTVAMINESFPGVKIIANRENVGFARANNQAIQKSRGRYLFLLNPDTVVIKGLLKDFVDFMDCHDKIGLLGPRLLNSDNTVQYSIRNFPTVLNQLYEALFFHQVFPKSTGYLGEVVLDDLLYGSEQKVGWVSGAAMIIRARAIEDVGLLDEQFFMYSEEQELCLRLKKAGWSINYWPGVEIVHYHGDTTKPEQYILQLSSRLKFYRKHYGYFERLGLRVALIVNLALRFLLWSFKGMLGKKNAGKRVRGYLAGLRLLVFKTAKGT